MIEIILQVDFIRQGGCQMSWIVIIVVAFIIYGLIGEHDWISLFELLRR